MTTLCLSSTIRTLPQACLANLMFRLGDCRGALKHYSLALKLRPADPGAHGKWAEFLLRAPDLRFRNPAKALEQARLACELSHYRNHQFVALLAQPFVKNGRFEEALEAARKALGLSVWPQDIQKVKQLAASVRDRRVPGQAKAGEASR